MLETISFNDVRKYMKESFSFDLKAGFITAIVAIPLAIAFAIASGLSAEAGLFTAVIAGFFGSLLGGSKFSITGPTGAMAVIVLSVVHTYGINGLMVATLLSGIILIVFGLLKVGQVIKFIPLPVISGFTAGIGVVIFVGQISNFFGLSVSSQEHVWDTIASVVSSIASMNATAVFVALFTMACLVFLPRLLKKSKFTESIPPSLLALVITTSAAFFLALNVPQIGQIAAGIPMPKMVPIDFALVKALLPSALTIALLGAIESLLCAVVADGMTSTKHDSNKELISQGVVNTVLPFFGGLPATAAIARTAVNIREGAKTRMAGAYHAVFILAIMLFLAPLAQYIPKAFLAGILMIVSIRMVNLNEFRTISKISKSDFAVLLLTFGLTIFTNLVVAIQFGMILALVILFVRMVKMMDITTMENYDAAKGVNAAVKSKPCLEKNVAIYTIHGPFFFGAMDVFERKIDEHIDMEKPVVILRMKHVPFIDTTGIERLKSFIRKRNAKNSLVLFSGVHEEVKKKMLKDEEMTSITGSNAMFHRTSQALEYAEKYLKKRKIKC